MRNSKQVVRDADAWLDWELLRRGVILGHIPPVSENDLVEMCGYQSRSILERRQNRAIKKVKVAPPV